MTQDEPPQPAKRKRRPKLSTPAARRTKTGAPRKTGEGAGGMKPDAVRIARVEELLRKGMGDAQVVKKVAIEFDVTERSIQYDVVRVWTEWQDAAAPDRPRRVARALNNMRYLQERAEKSDDAGVPGAAAAAIAAADKANRIEGVYAPDALKILQGELEGMQRLSQEDLDAEIERECAKMLSMMAPERRAVVLQHAGVEPGDLTMTLAAGNGVIDVAPGAEAFAAKLNQTLWPGLSEPQSAAEVNKRAASSPTIKRAKAALAKRRAAKES